MMLAATFGRVIFPLGTYRKQANVPGGKRMCPIQLELGEPGVRQGQKTAAGVGESRLFTTP